MSAILEAIHTGQEMPPVCLPPWLENPYRLVSWFDMLEFSAVAFLRCGRRLEILKTDCLVGSAVVAEGGVGFATAQDLDEKARKRLLASTASIREAFQNIGLDITAETVSDLERDVTSGSRRSFAWLHERIENIERLAEKELKGKLFLYIPQERVRYWPTVENPFAFGQFVSDSFPSTTFDANSAGVCLATAQSTAAVFHLMRILEIGLGTLGSMFGVSLAHTNWAPAIDQIESKVRDMHKDPVWKAKSDCKEQQEFYSQTATHFGVLKDAWRNYTMHARGKFTEEEAALIFANVKAFMQKLATRLHE